MTTKKAHKQAQILGTSISGTPKEQLLASVKELLSKKDKFYIVTPNPEIVLLASTNPKLKRAINKANISIPDGFGLLLTERILGKKRLTGVIHGREFFLDVLALAGGKPFKAYLLGDSGAESAQNALAQRFPSITFRSAAGPMLNFEGSPVSERDILIEKEIIRDINDFAPDMLFVAFGAPKQELWLTSHLSKLNIKGAMVIGGTLDYINGRAKLPPKLLSTLHLEWFWRLFTHSFRPNNVKRILTALVVFPLTVLKYRLKHS